MRIGVIWLTKCRLADDLIETFFSIVYPRFPIFESEHFRARFASSDTDPAGPLPHNLVAIVIAFGAHFSDNPVIEKDKMECTARDKRKDQRSRSRIIQLLVIRAREVVETTKTHRLPSVDNVRVLLLLEIMTSRKSANIHRDTK